MARGLDKLEDDINKFRIDIAGESRKLISGVAYEVLQHLVHNTPVDTSRAISNWQVGIDQSVDTEIPPHVEGKSGSSQGASIQRALQVGLGRLEAMSDDVQSVFISNDLNYIVDLNNNHQQKGFVEAAVIAGEKAAENGAN